MEGNKYTAPLFYLILLSTDFPELNYALNMTTWSIHEIIMSHFSYFSYTWRFNNRILLENFQELSAFPDIYNVSFHGPVLFVGGAKSDYIQ